MIFHAVMETKQIFVIDQLLFLNGFVCLILWNIFKDCRATVSIVGEKIK